MHQDLGELPLLAIFHIGCHIVIAKIIICTVLTPLGRGILDVSTWFLQYSIHPVSLFPLLILFYILLLP